MNGFIILKNLKLFKAPGSNNKVTNGITIAILNTSNIANINIIKHTIYFCQWNT